MKRHLAEVLRRIARRIDPPNMAAYGVSGRPSDVEDWHGKATTHT